MSASTTTATTPLDTIVSGYFAMWNEADAAQRRAVIAATWAPDAHYVDPLLTADGAEGLDVMVAAVQEQFPGHRFRLSGDVDTHHDRARWDWELVGPDGGTLVAAGVDVATLAPDGRLHEVTGFFHRPGGAA
jgi:hypothetical protein